MERKFAGTRMHHVMDVTVQQIACCKSCHQRQSMPFEHQVKNTEHKRGQCYAREGRHKQSLTIPWIIIVNTVKELMHWFKEREVAIDVKDKPVEDIFRERPYDNTRYKKRGILPK